jgi:predicted amidophosphoribosyltransferase
MTLDLQTILLARAEEQVRSLRGRGALGEDDLDAPAPRLCDRCRARSLRKGNASGICASCNKDRRLCDRCHTERVHKNNRSGICWSCFERGER